MCILLLILAVGIAVLVLVGFAWTQRGERLAPEEDARPAVPRPRPAPAEPTLDRAALEERLAGLARAERPSELSPGAMCYSVAAAPQRAEYVCPVCGERTIYTLGLASRVERELPECRRLARAIEGISVTLDETDFCRRCKPEAKSPKLVATIRVAGGEPRTVEGITPEDLKLLQEFLAGSLTHEAGFGRGEPLARHLERIQKLLGVRPG